MSTESHIATLHDAAEAVSAESLHLLHLADAFDAVCNDGMARKLRATARRLEVAAERSRRATGPIVMELLHSAQRSATSALHGTLAGIELAHKEQA